MQTKLNAIILELYDRPLADQLQMGALVLEVPDRPRKEPLRFGAGILEERQELPNTVILAK